MSCIDWSRWNTAPWWRVNGYRTREEAWADFSSSQDTPLRREAAASMNAYMEAQKRLKEAATGAPDASLETRA